MFSTESPRNAIDKRSASAATLIAKEECVSRV